MSTILRKILGKMDKVDSAVSSYIDDLIINETEVTMEGVVAHLRKFGLISKLPESMDGGKALRLRLKRDETGKLQFRRENKIPQTKEEQRRRELFSIRRKLTGHYPIAGWQRIACRYIKRQTEEKKWDDVVSERTTAIMKEVQKEVEREDPVKGSWDVPRIEKGMVWCDASSIETGGLIEIGMMTENSAWLQKKDDASHVNVAELDSVLKGVNQSLKWELRDEHLKTDSVMVVSWIKSVVTNEKRVKTKGAAEMLVKRRLGILGDLIQEFGLKFQLSFMSFEKNKVGVLTRVR